MEKLELLPEAEDFALPVFGLRARILSVRGEVRVPVQGVLRLGERDLALPVDERRGCCASGGGSGGGGDDGGGFAGEAVVVDESHSEGGLERWRIYPRRRGGWRR